MVAIGRSDAGAADADDDRRGVDQYEDGLSACGTAAKHEQRRGTSAYEGNERGGRLGNVCGVQLHEARHVGGEASDETRRLIRTEHARQPCRRQRERRRVRNRRRRAARAAHAHYHLAHVLAGLQQPQRRAQLALAKGKGGVRRRAHSASLHLPRQPAELRLHPERLTVPAGAVAAAVVHGDRDKVGGGSGGGGTRRAPDTVLANIEEGAGLAKQPERGGRKVARECAQYDLHAAAAQLRSRAGGEALRAARAGERHHAEPAQRRVLGHAAGGGVHARAAAPQLLECHEPDAAGGRVQQHALARAHARFAQRVRHCHPQHRQRDRLVEAQAARHAAEPARVRMEHGAQRARRQAEDALAGPRVRDVSAAREQPTRHLAPQRPHLARRVATQHVEHVAEVEPGGRHCDHAAVRLEGAWRERLCARVEVKEAAGPLEVSLDLRGQLGRRAPFERAAARHQARR